MGGLDKGSRGPQRHPGGRTCQLQALALTVLAPLAVPVLVARTVYLRKKGRI